MDDLMEPYRRTRARVSTLLLDATPDALARTVPACPAWTVHDLAAHLAGVPATLAAGNFPSGDINAWLQGIVDERRGTEVGQLVQEWNALDAAIEPMLQGMGTLMFTDVAVHEHDLRGALGEPDHGALEVDAAMACGLPSFAQPLQDAGLDAIVVQHDDHTWRSHDADAGWTLHVTPWEATRALGSRRTVDELRALPGEGDAEPYFVILDAHLPLPERSLGE
jgi:Mycothiol maleylpyruvate isomerase N-terminal domain